MLVLQRHVDEEIVIARGEIVVKVIEISKHWVKLGIVAPKDIPIHRREVEDKILEAERSQACPPTPTG